MSLSIRSTEEGTQLIEPEGAAGVLLELSFETGKDTELVQIRYRKRPGEKPQTGLRGKQDTKGHVAFQWSAGVRALALFFIKARFSSLRGEVSGAVLEGTESTAAASLDYVLSRQSNWLLDLFGVDAQGVSQLRRVISRSNPERKRPGPVLLFLNTNMLAPTGIRILENGADISSNSEALSGLVARVAAHWSTLEETYPPAAPTNVASMKVVSITAALPESRIQLATKFPRPFHQAPCREMLKNIFREELDEVFSRRVDFSNRGLKRAVAEFFDDSVFKHFGGENQAFFEPLLKPRPASLRLGVVREEEVVRGLLSKDGNPIQVALPGGYVAGMALFTYLAQIKKYPFEIEYQFVHAGEVFAEHERRLDQAKHRLSLLGDGHLAEALSTGLGIDYIPLMLMPELSFQIIASGGRKQGKGEEQAINGSDFHLLAGEKSSSLLFFHRLIAEQKINPKQIALHRTSPDELAAILAEGQRGVQALQWFPYYRLNEIFNSCSLLLPNSNAARFRPNVMICHKELALNAERALLIEQVLRDAWLSLVESEALMEQTIDLLCQDPHYIRFLSRTAGFHHLRFPEGQNIKPFWRPKEKLRQVV